MKETFFKKSLNRIFQELYSKEQNLEGKVLEFGATEGSSKNFTNFLNLNDTSQIIYADKITNNNKKVQYEDLEKKLSFQDASINNVVIFNVLEHVYDINNAIKEINRCLKPNGRLVGSTPFIYRVHNAPQDYNRYTPAFINEILNQNNFSEIKIKTFGYGPLIASYVLIFDYTKYIPLLNNILFNICLIMDNFISILIKTKLKKIYPITICFSAKKSQN
tara:strand:- start:60 stop:716 length:657 start_codon:yes stop_codon:yes gene_type:complete